MATKAQAERRFVPKWEGDFKLQALSLALKNEWRTVPDRDLDDLMQEAHIKFWHIKTKWKGQSYTRARFANTFRCSLTNLFNNYAKQRTRRKRRGVGVGGGDTLAAMGSRDMRPAELEVKDLLRAARNDAVLHRIIRNLVTGEFKLRPGYRESRPETLNEFLCRVAKVGSEIDMVRLVKDWIGGESPVVC